MTRSKTPAAATIAAAFLGLLGGCTSGDGSLSWQFVSRPGLSGGSGDEGGSVIVIRRTALVSADSAEGFGWHRVRGFDARGAVAVYLATGTDAALIEREDETEVRSPVLDRAVLRVPAPVLTTTHVEGPLVFELAVQDCGLVDPGAFGAGSLWIARGGNLVVLRHQLGVIVWGETRAPQRFDPPHTVTLDDRGLVLNMTAGRSRVLRPAPLPALDERVQQDRGRQSLRLFGTRGELIAELPVSRVQLFDGSQGVFLTANLPHGVDVRDPRPMVLVMAQDNRHLVRIED